MSAAMSDNQIRAALHRMQEDALSRGDHAALYRAAGMSRDWARGFLGRADVIPFLSSDGAACVRDGSPVTDEMVTAALDELVARINNKIQPTAGTMRAVLEAAEAARINRTGDAQ